MERKTVKKAKTEVGNTIKAAKETKYLKNYIK
jgi:hypothetical protein